MAASDSLENFLREQVQAAINQLFQKVNALELGVTEFRTAVTAELRAVNEKLPEKLECDAHAALIADHDRHIIKHAQLLQRFNRRLAMVAAVFTVIGALLAWVVPAVAELAIDAIKHK